MKHVHVIINPGAGQPQPILHPLNQIFYEAEIDWSVSITSDKTPGDVLARQAIEKGVDMIAAYGGDGTVNSVIRGMIGSDIPLALLHGGTGNALAYEMCIPIDLADAAKLIIGEHDYQWLDVGEVTCVDNPDEVGHFVLRTTVGIQNKMMQQATPTLKEQFGNLAYVVAGLRSLAAGDRSTFKLTIDGETHESQGLTCMITNSAAVKNFKFSSQVDPTDGELDALIFDLNFESILDMMRGTEETDVMRGKEIKLEVEPPAEVNLDGEPFGNTPIMIKVLPHAIKVLKGDNH